MRPGSNSRALFGPKEQIEALHPAAPNGKRAGTVSFAAMTDEGWKEWSVRASEAPHIAKDLIDHGKVIDLYVSHQRFRGWRKTERLLGLASLYCDVDFHSVDAWRGKDPSAVLVAILNALQEARIPFPSYVLDTGRGLLLVWLHDMIPAAATSRWSAVEKRVVATLIEFGADRKATDVARVFRVVFSINSKAEPARRVVGMIWCLGNAANPYRYDFDTLAGEVLPFTRAQLHSLRAEKASRPASERRQRSDGASPRRALTQADWGEKLLVELQALRVHRHPDGRLPSGERDVWLLLAAVAVSYTCPPEALEATMERLAESYGGWTSRETRSRIHAVFKRSRQAAAGETIEYKGKLIDPRYRYKSATIVDLLDISSGEQAELGLRLLVDADRKRELAAERARELRKARAVKPNHAEARERRLRTGRKALYLQAKTGGTRDELAAQLGVSAGLLTKALKEARAERERRAA